VAADFAVEVFLCGLVSLKGAGYTGRSEIRDRQDRDQGGTRVF
jgi:hypothetical protein